MANDERRRGSKVLRFAVSGALLLAPAASGCGSDTEELHVNEPAPEEHTVNEPVQDPEPIPVPVNEPAPANEPEPTAETDDDDDEATVNEPAESE